MRRTSAMLTLAAALAGTILATSPAVGKKGDSTMPVSGSGVHFFSRSIVHSQEPTPRGMIRRATETVELSGDLRGYVLYHVTSEFDFVNNTLTNTGTQFFSGTVGGSDPIVLHDDQFRFVVDLVTGATTGEVHLRRSKDAPDRSWWYECDLEVVGTGLTPEGDATFDYDGECARKGSKADGDG